MRITRQQDYFAREYITDFDGPRAARAAGVPRSTSGSRARAWLQDAAVAERVAELYEAKVAAIPDVVMSPDEVLIALSQMARADRRRLEDEEGRGLSLHELPEDVAALVDGYEGPETIQGADGPIETKPAKYKLSSRLAPLKMLAEHHNLFEKDKKASAGKVFINITGKDAEA